MGGATAFASTPAPPGKDQPTGKPRSAGRAGPGPPAGGRDPGRRGRRGGHPPPPPLPPPGPADSARPPPALRGRGLRGGGGGAAPQSRAAPLPAAINSRPAQHVPAAAAAGAPAGAAVPSRRVARPERGKGAGGGRGFAARVPAGRSGAEGVSVRGGQGPRGGGGRAGAGAVARHPPAPRGERPAGTRVGAAGGAASAAAPAPARGAESRFAPVSSFSLFFQTALSRAGTRSSCLPKPSSRGWDPSLLPPRFPAFPGVGRVPGTEDGVGLRTQPPAPLGSSDRASARTSREVAGGTRVHPCCGTAKAVKSRLVRQGGESPTGATRVAPKQGAATGTRPFVQVSVLQPPSLKCFRRQQMSR